MANEPARRIWSGAVEEYSTPRPIASQKATAGALDRTMTCHTLSQTGQTAPVLPCCMRIRSYGSR
ncbi:hypothetical protein OHA72_10265 [Dactylosporangium sp. NBC_01737]|uniref:hypothetical protein n=1 Tax=Dactylosporangium sp. NBC_01737 TaxID=2975959 RepID=UPI002E0E5137|nr:hypothetical protein OHA72_10265 [Dactylosporangium sp. NBC_01737]